MQRLECVPEAELTAFLLGEVTDDVLEEIAGHLDSCSTCEQKAKELDHLTDPAIAALRGAPANLDTSVKEADTSPDAESGSVAPEHLPSCVGDYEILGILGRGGMGVVYLARHPQLQRRVALKMMIGSRFADSQARARFQTEAQAIARLQHPGIVQIFEIGEWQSSEDGPPVPFFTLELVEGGSLDQITGQPHPSQQAAQWIESLARAVHHAHQEGIIHRDLKPANVLQTPDGQLKITDFGIAKFAEGSDLKTLSGFVIGTPEHLSPEQAMASSVIGPEADIYALGTILYQFLTGRPPFLGVNVLSTLDQVVTQEPVAIRRIQPLVERDLETICLKCLEKKPDRRYPTARALADDLQRFQNGEPIHARPVSSLEKLRKWVRRRPGTAALLASLILVTLTGLGLVTWKWREALFQKNLANVRLTAMVQAREEEAAAKRETGIARQHEKKERSRAQVSHYASQMLLTQREAQDGFVGRAEEILSSCDPKLRSWEHRFLTTLCKRRLRKFQGKCSVCATFSPDGQYVAGVGVDEKAHGVKTRLVVVWEVGSGRVAFVGRSHLGGVRDLAFGPRSLRLVSAGADNTAKIWDVKKGTELRSLRGHTDAVSRVEFSPAGDLIATASLDRTFRIWNATTGKELMQIPQPHFTMHDLGFSSDGQLLASGSMLSRRVIFWDVKTGKQAHVLEGPADELHRKSVAILKRLPRYFLRRAGSADGRLTAIWLGNLVKIAEARTGKEILTLKSPNGFNQVALGPDGQALADASGQMEMWDLSQRSEALVLKAHVAPVQGLAFSPRSDLLASAGEDYKIGIWDTTSGNRRHLLQGHKQSVEAVAFSPDGTLLASASWDRTARIWDVKSGELVQTLQGHAKAVTGVCFTATGNQLVTTSNQTIRVWDWRTATELRSFQGHTRGIRCLALSPDGRHVLTGSHDSTIRLWDLMTGKEIRTFEGHASSIWAVTFSPDGKRLASASWDKTARIWDVETGKVIHALSTHRHYVRGVAFSPDGKRLATASYDRTVKLWDVHTGQEILTLNEHKLYVLCVAFSSDGRFLATAGDDLHVRLWISVLSEENTK